MGVPGLVEEGEEEPADDAEELVDDDEPADEESEQPDEPDEPDEPDVAEAEITDDDLTSGGGSDLFTSVEDSTDASQSDDGDDGGEESDSDDGDGSDGSSDASEVLGGGLDERVNNGLARLLVVGLDDEYKMDDEDDTDTLEAEFRDVADLFGVGHYSAEFVSEYVLVGGEDDIDPAYGLLGSMIAMTALAIYMRPDGDEITGNMREAAGDIGASLGVGA